MLFLTFNFKPFTKIWICFSTVKIEFGKILNYLFRKICVKVLDLYFFRPTEN